MSKVFRKELIQSRWQIMLLFLVLTFMFAILGLTIINNSKSSTQLKGPDIEVYGKLTNPVGYEYYKRLDINLKNVEESNDFKIYPLVLRNLISVQDEITLMKIEYTVIGCTMDFIEEQLNQFIERGDVPDIGSKEVLIGKNIAAFYYLDVGDTFDSSLMAKPPYEYIGLSASIAENFKDIDTTEWKVSGVLNSNNLQYDCSLFVPNQVEDIKRLSNKVNIFFKGTQSENSYTTLIDTIKSNGEDLIGNIKENYFTKLQQDKETRMLIAVVSINIALLIYIILLYIFKADTRKIGILSALGLRNSTIVKYYVYLFTQIEAASLLLSMVIIVFYVYYQNNNLVNMLGVSEPLYVLNLGVIAFLLILALIFLIILIIFTYVKVINCKVRNAMLNTDR